MVDTCVSGAYGAIHAGSSPAFGIFICVYEINLISALNLYGKHKSIGFQDSCNAFVGLMSMLSRNLHVIARAKSTKKYSFLRSEGC